MGKPTFGGDFIRPNKLLKRVSYIHNHIFNTFLLTGDIRYFFDLGTTFELEASFLSQVLHDFAATPSFISSPYPLVVVGSFSSRNHSI
jgi:hypothetical protein